MRTTKEWAEKAKEAAQQAHPLLPIPVAVMQLLADIHAWCRENDRSYTTFWDEAGRMYRSQVRREGRDVPCPTCGRKP